MTGAKIARTLVNSEISEDFITSLFAVYDNSDYWQECKNGADMLIFMKTFMQELSEPNYRAMNSMKLQIVELVLPFLKNPEVHRLLGIYSDMTTKQIGLNARDLEAATDKLLEMSQTTPEELLACLDTITAEDVIEDYIIKMVMLVTRPTTPLATLTDFFHPIKHIIQLLADNSPLTLMKLAIPDAMGDYIVDLVEIIVKVDEVAVDAVHDIVQHVCADIIRKHFPNLEDIVGVQ